LKSICSGCPLTILYFFVNRNPTYRLLWKKLFAPNHPGGTPPKITIKPFSLKRIENEGFVLMRVYQKRNFLQNPKKIF